MQNLKALLAEHGAVLELDFEEHVKALEGCVIVSDKLVARIESKGREEIAGFEQIGYDPGEYACAWSLEVAVKARTTERLPFEEGSYYMVDSWRRETVVQMDGFALTLKSEIVS